MCTKNVCLFVCVGGGDALLVFLLSGRGTCVSPAGAFAVASLLGFHSLCCQHGGFVASLTGIVACMMCPLLAAWRASAISALTPTRMHTHPGWTR